MAYLFKRAMSDEPVKALTVGGSDSGGAAGVQADLKTWTALGVYGMSAITAVTAQNSKEVQAITYLPADMVAAQIEAVLVDYGAQVVKIGFVGRPALAQAIARTLENFGGYRLVVDPVLVNHQGRFMFDADVIRAYRDLLLPVSDLITPNWREAALLAGRSVEHPLSDEAVKDILHTLHGLDVKQILITGSKQGEEIVDYWSDGLELQVLHSPVIDTANVHGSGDTLSAAIGAFLARGDSMAEAISNGRAYTTAALRGAVNWRLGGGHGPLSHFS